MNIEENKTSKNTRDGLNTSLWQPTASMPEPAKEDYPDTLYDTLIVGAGITGMTTALLLQKAGQKCIVVDAHRPGFGTTGGTSAHINTFADTSYDVVISDFDLNTGKLFARAIGDSVSLIAKNVSDYRIDCDFEWKQAYLYAETGDQSKELEDLYAGTQEVGVSAIRTKDVPTHAAYQKAILFDKQAQFHPLKYIGGLQAEFQKQGGVMREHTLVETIESEHEYHIAKTSTGDIKAKNVVYATHIPPGGINVLHFRCAPYRSYVLAATLKNDDYPDVLMYDMQEPYHYLRSHAMDGKKYLIVGGEDHKTAHGDPESSFANLEAYVRRYYDVDEIAYRWSSQYYVPADGLPYIGQLPGTADGIYTATGFNGNGMILGTVSAIELSQLILNKESKYEGIFNPARIKPIAGFGEFIKENADVAYRFIADRFDVEKLPALAALSPDTGEVVDFEDQKVAVYKDASGALHALNPICTHAKCVVAWNTSEKSWDCPCHGARFDCHGNVLTGPARAGLEQINLKSLEEK